MTAPAVPFPHPTLPSLHGEPPNRQRLDSFLRSLRANAISVPSNGGDGRLGHLALVVTPALYGLQSGGIDYVPPANPGTHPVHPDNATGPQITEINRSHLAQKAEHKAHVDTENALKTLIIEAVPKIYLHQLADPITEFANVSVLTMVNHLIARFGTITDTDLENNLQALQLLWNTAEAIDTVWANVTDCRAFAEAGGDPISDRTTIAAVLQTFTRTGQFATAIHEWRQLTAAEKTYDNLIVHFNTADAERRLLLTTSNAGFHGNALLVATETASLGEQALIAPAVAPPAAAPPATGPRPMYYCHSHGLSTNPDHTSETCRTRAPGHITTATVDNMRGGCNLIQRRRNERVVWTAPPPRASTQAPTANN
jgi:hypothetical protein